MPTFIARSGSFNDLKITNLASSSQANIIAIDSASGQLYYMSTASFGGGGGIPGGLNKQIQFNSASVFSGSSDFIYDYAASNLILNVPNFYSDPGYSINDPNNSSGSILIGYTLTGSYIETGLEPYAQTSVILGTYNKTHDFGSPYYLYNSFVVGNGWYDINGLTVSRENAIEIGRDYSTSGYYPFIKLPQLSSNNTGYVVTIDPSSKQLYYSAFNVVGGSPNQIQFNNAGTLGGVTGFNYSNSVLQRTGSFIISGSEYILGSGSAIFEVDGTVGPLLTINDSNSGSLFTVNDISGMSILDVRSDSSVLMGSSNAPSLNTTKKVTTTGAQSFALGGTLISTASYNAAFFEYVAYSASNARAGNISAVWNGTTIASSSTTTTDIGSTTGLTTFAAISGSYIVLSGSAGDPNWTVKSIIRAI